MALSSHHKTKPTHDTVDDGWEAIEYCFRQNWTDGLPVVPPREDLVERALSASKWEANDVLLAEPVRGMDVTAQQVAACAVMAGCQPAYLPVVIAALKSMGHEDYNLHGSITSTGGATPLIAVNGPVRDELEINYQTNLFGPGSRANATIGRAVRLIIMNSLGSRPGLLDRSTQGNFGKYSACFGEFEDVSPWGAFHTSRGYAANESAVTVFAAESGHNILCHATAGIEQLLLIISDTMAAMGSFSPGESLLVIAPEHARHVSDAGWSRVEVQTFLFEHARRRFGELTRAGKLEHIEYPPAHESDSWIHRGEQPADIHIFFGGGGAGGHSAFFPSWSRMKSSRAITTGLSDACAS